MRRAWKALILSLALLISTIGAEGSWRVICQMPIESRPVAVLDAKAEDCESACCDTAVTPSPAPAAEKACCLPEKADVLVTNQTPSMDCCSVEVDRFGFGGSALDRSNGISDSSALAEAPLRLPIVFPTLLPSAEPLALPINEPLPDDPVRLPGGTRAPPVA